MEEKPFSKVTNKSAQKLADSKKIKTKYTKQTEIAESKGIFGSPSFIIDNEVFWGDDRLEDAISWSKKSKK